MNRSILTVKRWLNLTIALFVLLLGMAAPVSAQLPIPSPSIPPDSSNPPAGVQRYGAIEVAPISFNGAELFKVVAPTVRDRRNPGALTPVEIRAEEVRANLKRVLAEDLPEEVQQKRGYNQL